MKKGEGAILTENVIYKYLNYKLEKKELRLKPIYLDGRPYSRLRTYINVTHMKSITSTSFPDIDEIVINKESGIRPAEIKYLTSKFDYHSNNKYIEKYYNFKESKGCLIVYRHDTFPRGLLNDYKIDVFEIDQEDFVSFVKENFNRLFFQQVFDRDYTNIWLMYAGPDSNFYKSNQIVPPAFESKIWCSLKRLTPLHLTKNDKVIFFKTKGSGQQDIRRRLEKGIDDTNRNWILDDLWVCTVNSPCIIREEYCQINHKNYKEPLWYSETVNSKIYPYVFGFDIDFRLKDLNINLYKMKEKHNDFVNDLKSAFFDREKLTNTSKYLRALEYILLEQNKKLTSISYSIEKMEQENQYYRDLLNTNIIEVNDLFAKTENQH